jgi:hypothetical protein
MIKFMSFLVVALIMANVSVFANDEMQTNMGAPVAPAVPAQGVNPGTSSESGMKTGNEMGKQEAKREPARRRHRRRHHKRRHHR